MGSEPSDTGHKAMEDCPPKNAEDGSQKGGLISLIGARIRIWIWGNQAGNDTAVVEKISVGAENY